MKCRIDIKGQKIWRDNDNAYSTRPPSTDIILYRDNEVYKTVTLDSSGNGHYSFLCLVVWKNPSQKYLYRIDELEIPIGYTKTIKGYDVINTLENVTISGVKTWIDDNNAGGHRPTTITLHLWRNGVEIDNINVASPPDTEDTADFSFGELAFADANGVPYVYSITEDPIEFYTTQINGFNITNTSSVFPLPFSFSKSDIRTSMHLQGAEFVLLQNGVIQATAISDEYGTVQFAIPAAGTYQLQETQPPAGYMDDTTVYQVFAAPNGTISVDGMPATQFIVENSATEYDVTLVRASQTVPEYQAAPNSWPLNGTGLTDLCMVDKILIESNEAIPILVKWDHGIRDASYFITHGIDITTTYTNGIPVDINDSYTVYLAYENGYEAVLVINIDNLRNGTQELPYLLLDFENAENLESSVPGIGQFTLDYMQGDGIKQTQYYELYENISMEERTWVPLGGQSAELFTGGLNGNSHDITNLIISYPSGIWFPTGLFSRVGNGAIIENLGLIDCAVTNKTTSAAAFAGLIGTHDGTTTILKNLSFSGSVTTETYGAGIAADINVTGGKVLIDGCTVNGSVSGNTVGGIISTCLANNIGTEISITNSDVIGLINGIGITGGIAGNISSYGESVMTIKNNINRAAVQGEAIVGGIIGSASSFEGGIIGSASSFEGGIIASSCNLGAIKGVTRVGGIAGDLTSSTQTNMMSVENSYNAGNVTVNATGSSLVGGIVGSCYSFISIQNCYNVGDVISSGGVQNTVGGISANYGRIENCASIGSKCSSPQLNVARISVNTMLMQEWLLDNNIAFNNMQVLINGVQKTPLDSGSAGTDGIDLAATVIKTQTQYENSLGWDFDNIWDFADSGYTLPTLKDIPSVLQPNVLPAHLL